jgi:glycerophosphoryl diester phosphodiesterase family protein
MTRRAPLFGAVEVDYRGSGYALGRTTDAYAIWDQAAGGAPQRAFPLTVEGWTEAWHTYQELERIAAEGRPRAGSIPPLLVGQIVAGAFAVYRRHVRVLVGIAAAVVLPYYAGSLALILATLRVVPQRMAGQTGLAPEVPGWVDAVNNVALYVFVVPFLTAAMVTATVWALVGRRPTVRAAYVRALGRVRSVLLVSLLSGVAAAAPMTPGILVASRRGTSTSVAALAVVLIAAGIVPAVFLALRFLFGPPAVVLEGLRGVEALRRSWMLVRGRTWKVLGALLLAFLILFAALLLLVILGLAFLLFRDLTEGLVQTVVVLVTALTAVGVTVVGPFVSVVIVLLYLDGRARTEDLTTDALAAELDQDG